MLTRTEHDPRDSAWAGDSGDVFPIELKYLMLVLSLTAGSLDVITFLGFGGLFAAHVTGNLVVTAAHAAAGATVRPVAMLSVPVFMLVLGLARVVALHLEATNRASLPSLLLLQLLFLAGLLGLAVTNHLATETMATFALLLGVSAMAVQNAVVNICLKGAPATASMTTNVVAFTIDSCTMLLRPDRTSLKEARCRARRTWPSIVGFGLGCVIGAACEARFGLHSLALPAALSLLALFIAKAGNPEGDLEYDRARRH